MIDKTFAIRTSVFSRYKSALCVCVINSFNELRNRYGHFQRDTGRVFLATRDVLNCYSVMAVVEVAIIRF